MRLQQYMQLNKWWQMEKHIPGTRHYSDEYYYISQEISAESDKEPLQ